MSAAKRDYLIREGAVLYHDDRAIYAGQTVSLTKAEAAALTDVLAPEQDDQ